ncbi:hypothetical protein ZIOFF_045008 [Zingiber officinale]|uniref:Uncharacterized protein n=1 Tax=Zingiber officinale TaxID=94328 RepID=A0A8J5FWB7_ZINOF|nr:hypothetical protein ZIOFF_045008 [Zingiber officinale]
MHDTLTLTVSLSPSSGPAPWHAAHDANPALSRSPASPRRKEPATPVAQTLAVAGDAQVPNSAHTPKRGPYRYADTFPARKRSPCAPPCVRHYCFRTSS